MMPGGDDVLSLGDQFLIELFTGPQPDEFDLDVFVRLESGKRDQVLRHIQDPDRTAHIEDEDLPPISHGARLEDQLAGLGNRHEIADDIRVGHGHRAALFDLFFEQRHHAPHASHDVAEADRDILGPGKIAGILPLGQEFRRPLAGAHDVGRPDRFVRRDQHEFFNLVPVGEIDHVPGADDVVGHRLPGVHLQHGDMFIGRRVENDPGAVGLERIGEMDPVADVREQGDDLDIRKVLFEFDFNVVKGALGLIVQKQRRRPEAADLPAQLRSDGPAGAGHHHAPVPEVGSDTLLFQVDHLPA